MIKKAFYSFVIFSVLLFVFQPAYAVDGIPKKITYHGILKNSSGSFLTGTYSMVFTIYDDDGTSGHAGNNLWSETQSSVSVTSGRFSVLLGSVTSFPSTLNFTKNYWLGVKVGTDNEMSPRVQLTSAGYAMIAEDVTGGKLTAYAHSQDSHMNIEGVRNALTNIAKTNFKLDAYSLASANSMGDLIMDTFTDASGIDTSNSTGYAWRGSPNYDVVTGQGGIDSYTMLVLHANGTDGNQTFTDSSGNGHNPTAVQQAQHDTDQKKFGTSSVLLDGNGDYLSIADHNDFDFPGTWAIDFWVRFNSVDTVAFYSKNPGATGGILLQWNSGQGFVVGLGAYSSPYTFSWSPSANVWYHVAVTRDGSNNLRVFIDGTQIGSTQTDSTDLTNTATAYIGAHSGSSQYLNGWMDEFRISKGDARWTGNFTPPTSEYTTPGTTATVKSNAFSEPAAPTEAMVIASTTPGSGSITYYVSRNNGTDWTQCTNEQVCNISSQPTGTQLRWKAVITGNTELESIAVAV